LIVDIEDARPTFFLACSALRARLARTSMEASLGVAVVVVSVVVVVEGAGAAVAVVVVVMVGVVVVVVVVVVGVMEGAAESGVGAVEEPVASQREVWA
jgi:hypothetical protein